MWSKSGLPREGFRGKAPDAPQGPRPTKGRKAGPPREGFRGKAPDASQGPRPTKWSKSSQPRESFQGKPHASEGPRPPKSSKSGPPREGFRAEPTDAPRGPRPPKWSTPAPREGSRSEKRPSKFPSNEPVKPGPQKTLERVLSKAGLGSRTQARAWIHAGRVAINGKVVENPDEWVDFKADNVTFDGRPLHVERKVYVLLYKPKGYVTTASDPDGRPTVYDLIKTLKIWVSPVGRLDLDTTGLLLLTNDTQFAERMTNPDHAIPKTYQAKCNVLLTDEQLERLRTGVELDDGPTKPAIVRRIRDSAKYSFLEITVTEGRNRQVRRMIEAVGPAEGAKVLKLTRVSIGPIRLGDLQIGTHRELTEEELAELKDSRPGR